MSKHEEERQRCMKISHERGDFVCGDDGDYVVWPDGKDGAMSPHHLRWIADELDRLNKEWDDIVQKEFSC